MSLLKKAYGTHISTLPFKAWLFHLSVADPVDLDGMSSTKVGQSSERMLLRWSTPI
jgi:hypothetical protein